MHRKDAILIAVHERKKEQMIPVNRLRQSMEDSQINP